MKAYFVLLMLLVFSLVDLARANRPEDILTYGTALPKGTFPISAAQAFDYPAGLEQVIILSGRMGQWLGLGHCPTDNIGCFDLNNDRLLGCCHRNQTCAMQLATLPGQSAHFLGCVDDPLQLCYNMMCPPGYSCCRSSATVRKQRQTSPLAFCLPFDTQGWTFDPAVYGPYPEDVQLAGSDYDAFCGTAVDVYVSGVTLGVAQTLFAPWTMYNTTAGQEIAAQCTGVVGSYCAAGDACNTLDYVVGFNSTLQQNIVQTVDTYCCPPDQTLCMWGMDPPNQWDPSVPLNITQSVLPSLAFLGCAIDDRAETCCGSSICSGESKCCAGFVPSTVFDNSTATEYTYNTTALTFCCPNVANCCFGRPFDSSTQWLNHGPYGSEGQLEQDTVPSGSYGYCGAPYQGNPCALDIGVPQGHLLSQFMLP